MHNHLVAPEVVAFLEREGARDHTRIVEREGQRFFVIHETARRPLHARISQVEARLSDMDAEGVDLQAISCVPVMYPEVSAELGLTIARINNDALRRRLRAPSRPFCAAGLRAAASSGSGTRIKARRPIRFARCADSKRVWARVDEPQFEVFWETAEGLQMVVCIHLTRHHRVCWRAMAWEIWWGIRMTPVGRGTPDLRWCPERHPALRVVLYHGGGAFPSLVGRLDMGYRVYPECQAAIPRPPSTYINQLAFDIIAFRQDMLRYLITTYGGERLVVGSDYPLPAGLATLVAGGEPRLDPGTESAVLGGNASRLPRLTT
jgi:aminocarboxymuconate-semialdehyde decarboxylase